MLRVLQGEKQVTVPREFCLTKCSVPVETTSLIALLPSENNEDPLFIPRPVDDDEFLELWHNTVLPSMMSTPEQWDGLNTAHFFRQGPSEQDSQPVILVSIESDSDDIKTFLREKFSQFFEEPLRSSIWISFEQSSVRRSGSGYLPPICEARNTAFQRYPKGGASIGIQNRLDCTATLGGFLLVGGKPHILTVDHIVPKGLTENSSISITHPSEQEGQGKPSWIRVGHFLNTLEKCCNACYELWKEHREETNFYKPVDVVQIQCPTAMEFKKLKDELFREFPAVPLGKITFRSEARSRCSLEGGQHETEMDWALVAIFRWAVPLDSPIHELKDFYISSVVPSARIKSSGRTSGEQIGRVNTARSIVRHTNPCRFTQEHSVVKDSDSCSNDWITGGIGVDGDSGSWIIDRDSSALYGMVWGRDRVKTNPICLFSPMVDIVADIKERTGELNVCLLGEEAIAPLPSKAKRKESFSIPTPFASRRMSEGSASQSMLSNMVSSKG